MVVGNTGSQTATKPQVGTQPVLGSHALTQLLMGLIQDQTIFQNIFVTQLRLNLDKKIEALNNRRVEHARKMHNLLKTH